MSADNYYMVRKHPLGGFTFVMGFASDVDVDSNEIIPEARESDPVFVTRDLAMEAALREDAEYGASFHPETCNEHRNVNMRCNFCGELDTFCLSCDLTTTHDCNQSSYINI
jgi:hypothetical protein